MDNSNKWKRLKKKEENENKSKRQPKAKPTEISIQQSDASMSGESEDSDPLPTPPSRPSRDHGKLDLGLVTQIRCPNKFEHKPLSRDPRDDQIRLLILHGGNPYDQIHCSFRTYSLAMAEGKYEALSYCWGTEGDNCQIRIRTVAPRKPYLKGWKRAIEQVQTREFHIRPRLHDALMHLRLPDRDLCLWVDALCINQEDEVEKTQQVQKMSNIYGAAYRVLIWLGAGSKKCEEGLEFIEEILDFKTFEAKVKDESSPPKWAALVELMRQDWFSRGWVIQELALARDATIHYNRKSVNWKGFADALAMLATRLDDIKRLFLYHREYDHNPEYLGDIQALGAYDLVEVIAYHFRTSSENPNGLERLSSLELLVSRLHKFEASDPRDIIYALLSIYRKHDGSDEELVPNYEKSIIEVYRDFTEYCVSTSRSIDIIFRHWAPVGWNKSATLQHPVVTRKKHKNNNESRANAKMPSWVPLLIDSPFGDPHDVPLGRVNGDSLVGGPDRKWYNACGGKFQEPRFEDKSLYVTNSMQPRSVSISQTDRPANLSEHAPKLGQRQEEAGFMSVGSPRATDYYGVGSPRSTSSRSSSGGSAQSVASQRLPPVSAFFMFVTGITLDTVTEVSATIAAGVLSQECLEMGGWKGRNEQQAYHDGQQGEVPDRLWQTLVAGRGPDGGRLPTFYKRACLGCFDLANRSGDINTTSLIADPRTPHTLKVFLKRVQSIVWNRLFFRSDRRKLFGLGPRGTRGGDFICILYGCSVPVILRAQSDPESLEMYYEVVGECFIYGMMDGEAVANVDHKNDILEFKLG